MEDCVFCKIVKGELPAHRVYEDATFLAFLDIHPETPGHIQVIPKKHYRWVWDVPEFAEYCETVLKLAKAERKAFGTDWIISKIIGDEVPHAHIWILPGPDGSGERRAFEENAEKIRQALG